MGPVQAMYLPIEVWAMISKNMAPREWAVACGACSTTYMLRKPLVVAEVRTRLNNPGQSLAGQLQLDKWRTCHSLCLDLRQIGEVLKVTEAQSKQIEQAGSTLPLLHCLHLVGSSYDVVKVESSVQALLLDILAKHVSVLTLEVRFVGVPLNLPNLHHLVLHLVPVP